MKKIYFILFIAILCTRARARAQCYIPQDLESRINVTNLAVIGTVSNSESFYDIDSTTIYTEHEILVDYYINDDGSRDPGNMNSVYMTTTGGRMGDEILVAYPSLRNIEGASGLFLLQNYRGTKFTDRRNVMIPVAVHESYLGYDPETGEFWDGMTTAGDFSQVSRMLERAFGSSLQKVSERDYVPTPVDRRGRSSHVITDINPLSVNAGIGDVITISGSGFGTIPGTVEFDSPDDGIGRGFVVVKGDDILQWTDTRIQVRVVSEAGSGVVRVVTESEERVSSTQSLTINYAITNLKASSGDVVTPLLIDDMADGDGGYRFKLSNNTANNGVSIADDAPAVAALQRAVQTWQLDGDYNIGITNTTTTIQVPERDGQNIISYDNNQFDFDNRLGNGTVGIAYSYYSACGGSQFEVVEMDVMFRRNGNPNGYGGSVNYDYGPNSSGGTDFESVALHELGHTHQLKHVADPNDVMSYRIINGTTQRTLGSGTLAGATYVKELSLLYNPPVNSFCSDDFDDPRDYLAFSAVSGNLPVELTSFTATGRTKDVLLAWNTASERDNSGFTIERSTDGINFTSLGWVDGRGTTSDGQSYEFADRSPASNINYYRLAQQDHDGTINMSEVRTVNFTSGYDALRVWPNPASSQMTVNYPNRDADREMIVYSTQGREISRFTAPAGTSIGTIEVADLPVGIYFLRDEQGDGLRFSVR